MTNLTKKSLIFLFAPRFFMLKRTFITQKNVLLHSIRYESLKLAEMKRLITLLLVLCTFIGSSAQVTAENKAFKNGETVNYTLKFNWGAIWFNVGSASWNVANAAYNGQTAHKVTLKTLTNKTADRYFVLRDTMVTYVTPKLVPLYFDKRGREGKRYKRDWVKYSYSGDKYHVNTWHRTDKNDPKTSTYSSTTPAYDMVSMMLRARSMDPTNWQKGHREIFMMADGKHCSQQSIVYRGKQTVKLDDMKAQYRCLVFSFMEKEGKKEKEIIKFYITDDDNHLPVRLDLALNFGSAKAFMTSCSGLRNPQGAKL